jgi:hypothetical protein
MKIKLTPKESNEFFHTALCNGLSCIKGYGLGLRYLRAEYDQAKSKLISTSITTESPCYEDILLQILKDGGTLTIVDHEGDGDMTRSITIKDVHERVQNTEANYLMEMVNENDDADTADAILQTVFFNEIIFG